MYRWLLEAGQAMCAVQLLCPHPEQCAPMRCIEKAGAH